MSNSTSKELHKQYLLAEIARNNAWSVAWHARDRSVKTMEQSDIDASYRADRIAAEMVDSYHALKRQYEDKLKEEIQVINVGDKVCCGNAVGTVVAAGNGHCN